MFNQSREEFKNRCTRKNDNPLKRNDLAKYKDTSCSSHSKDLKYTWDAWNRL